MADLTHIPYLIQLLEDDSPSVRSWVIKELASFGPLLKEQIKTLPQSLTPQQSSQLKTIFNNQKVLRLKHIWPTWFRLSGEYERLERALTIFSDFLNDADEPVSLRSYLDELAQEYRKEYIIPHVRSLAQFLFHDKGMKGDDHNYYNPQNSNLVYVIKEKKGIPISLTSVYLLVGHRLGLTIEGCHYPGHFLARVKLAGQTYFVDCFSGGEMIDERDLLEMRKETLKGIEDLLHETAQTESIIKRYLANLVRAYQLKGDPALGQVMINLFKELEGRIDDKQISELTPEEIINSSWPRFMPGQIIRHKRYGYSGIIVEMDDQCRATDSWYYGNQIQPDRDQPWFHVLVHGSDQVTYVAESNLLKEETLKTIEHPLLSYFFTRSNDAQYIRNNNPWPEIEF